MLFSPPVRAPLMAFFFLFIAFFAETSFAALEVKTLADGILVYSGPSRKYRPILRARKGRVFLASSNLAQSEEGEFYKVLIITHQHGKKKTKGKRRIGYISASDPLEVKGSVKKGVEDEILSIISFAQAESALHLQTWIMRDSNFIWTVGYQKYFAPDFYFKVMLGQLFNTVSGSFLGGAGFGLDQNFTGKFSLFAEFDFNVVAVNQEDVLFTNSESLNYMALGGGGIRYSADQYASVSVGMGQALIMNANNSFLSHIFGFAVEVGL